MLVPSEAVMRNAFAMTKRRNVRSDLSKTDFANGKPRIWNGPREVNSCTDEAGLEKWPSDPVFLPQVKQQLQPCLLAQARLRLYAVSFCSAVASIILRIMSSELSMGISSTHLSMQRS